MPHLALLPALAIGLGSAASGVAGAIGSSKAASTAANSAANSNALTKATYDQTRSDLSPYRNAGIGGLNMLTNALGTSSPSSGYQSQYGGYQGGYQGGQSQGGNAGGPNWGGYLQSNPDVMAGYNALPASARGQFPDAGAYAQFHYQNYGQSEGRQIPTEQAPAPADSGGLPNGYLSQPFNMTQANLEKTPGYQFNLSQGLKTVNNALGARGLLDSGAVLKGGAEYATGLADNTYTNQFNMDQNQKTNIYNRLMGLSQLGQNAAAQTGQLGQQAAGTVANTNAISAGQIGTAQASAANAIGGIGSSLANFGMTNALLSNPAFRGMYGH